MKRFNLELTDKQHQDLLELKEAMDAASVSEVLRRLVDGAYKREWKRWTKS